MTKNAPIALLLAATAALFASEAQSMPMFPVTVSGQECYFDLGGNCTQPVQVDWTLEQDGSFLDTYFYGGSWSYDAANSQATLSYAMDFDGDGNLDFAYDYVGTVVAGCVQGSIYDNGTVVGIWQGCVVP